MHKKLMAILLCGILAGMPILSFLLPDHYFSPREKRKLQQFPEFSQKTFLDGSFCDDFEAYTLDQFPGRELWITGKTLTELLLGKRDCNGVWFADNGSLIDLFSAIPAAQLEENIRQLQTLSRKAAEISVPVSVLLIPTAAEILRDSLPAGAVAADQQAVFQALEQAQLDVVNPTDQLLAHNAEYLYYRTDHHCTSLGAFYCWNAWKIHRGLAPDTLHSWTQEPLCTDFRGTTWAKTGVPWIKPDTITGFYRHPLRQVLYNGTDQADSIYARKALAGPDPYAVFLNSNQPLTVIQGSGDQGVLLLIKDSFGNTFAQFPVEEFREVHVVDLRFFREDLLTYMQQQGVTQVLVLYGLKNFAQDRSFHA